MKNKELPLGKPFSDDREVEAVRKVLESGCWAGTCEVVEEFEEKFAKTVGTKYSVAGSSCTTTIHASLLAIGIGIGDEVIIPSFTHPATGFAVAHCQATPVLVDVNLVTYTINPEEIRKRITDKTKAIMPIYAFGMVPDVFEIRRIADENGLKVVWDTATGLGAKYECKNAGTFSDCECFSLYPTKNIATGEGGMITTDDEEIAEKAHSLVDFGTTKHVPVFDKLGYNYRLSAIHAAIGICQLEKLPKFLKAKRELAEYYKKRVYEDVSDLYWLRPQMEPGNVKSAWQRFVCIAHHKDKTDMRDKLMNFLRKEGIGCTKGTQSLAAQPYFKNDVCCPNADFLYRSTITLPLYYGMEKEDVDYVIEKLLEFYKSSPL